MEFLTFDWVEGSPSHTPAHASQRSTSLHHQSPQRQKALLFGKGKTLPSLHCLQTCRPEGKEEYQIYAHIRDCMLPGEGNKDEGYCKCNFSAIWKLNVYRLLKYKAPTFYCEKDTHHKKLFSCRNTCLSRTGWWWSFEYNSLLWLDIRKNFSSQKGLSNIETGCPGKRLSHHPWRYSEDV